MKLLAQPLPIVHGSEEGDSLGRGGQCTVMIAHAQCEDR